MGELTRSTVDKRRAGIVIFLVVLAASLLAPSATALASSKVFVSIRGSRSRLKPRQSAQSDPTESADGANKCNIGQASRTENGHGAKGAACPRLPEKVAPASSEPRQARGKDRLGFVSEAVTNEAGDEIEVSTALPSNPYKAPFNKKCALFIPYLGAEYNPCGYITFYDANWETSEKAPDTNVEEDAEYDACGTPVSAGKTSGWHVIGTEYTLFGWHAGHEAEIPTSEPPSCLGAWKLVYSFTETFSDGETLSDSVEVPFSVTALPTGASAQWGGGNPSELSCSQQCFGDPINTATGEYHETTTDLAIPGRGPGLEMTRTYSSSAAAAEISSSLGRGWAFSYDMALSIDPETGDATVTNGNGSRTQFEALSEGFAAPPRVLASLVENEDGSYTYTVKARTIYTFDSSGKLVSVADLNGDETTLSYDEAGQLHMATDDAGRTFTFSYDEAGRLEGVEDSTGRSVGYGYDESGELSEITDVRGGTESFTYDENDLLLTREDARENVVLTNTYDESDRILTQTDGLENETTFSYAEGEASSTTEVTDPLGHVTKYEYANGILAKRIEAAGTSDEATWRYQYDPITLGIAAITDPNGYTTRMTYDSGGNRTSTEDALGHMTESAYDPLNDLTEYTDATGVTTTYEYDEQGNLLESSTPLVGSEPAESRAVEYAYGSEAHPGDITAITDPDGHTTAYSYDAAGDLESATDAAGGETTYTNDERGNRLTEVSPRGNAEGAKPSEYTTTFTYDVAGNRLTATDPLGDEREWAYDADGNVETETDANGHTTTYSYDAANRRTEVERPDGQTEQTAYDAGGNVESQTDGLEHSTTYSYDALDRLRESTDPLSRTTTDAYDGVGNLTSSEDPQGRTTTYAYDAANELADTEYEVEPAKDVEYGYDANGRRISMTDATGESSFEYDSLGRLVATTDGNSDTIEYGYDLAGNTTTITYPNGKAVNREFDEAERLSSVSDWLGNTTSFAYDADSNLTSTTFPEGTGNVDEYGYDRASRMSEIQIKQESEPLASLGYSRDKAGQLESLTSKGLPGGEEEAFEYDENNRLTKAGSETFAYDGANNLTEIGGTTGTYDAANQLERRADVVFGYDALGERTGESPGSAASYLSSFGSTGKGNGQFRHPAGIAIDGEGDIWVVDERNNRVQEFNEEGEYMTSFGSLGTKKGDLFEPSGIAIDSEENLWVVDHINFRVEEFNQSGKVLRTVGKEGEGDGEFILPQAIAIDAEDNVWVSDCCDGRIQEFSHKGKFVKGFGSHGTGEGEIYSAVGLAIDAGGDIWVADYGNRRLEEFNEEGEFLLEFGTEGSGAGEFKGPGEVAIDTEGHLWAIDDNGDNRVEEFDQEGKFLGEFGTEGSGEGEFSFGLPMGLASDSLGGIWVTDSENDRVQRWEVAEAEPATSYAYDQAGDLTAVERPEGSETAAIEESFTYDGGGLRASETVSETTTHLTWDQSGGLPLLLSEGATSYIYGPGGRPIEQVSEGTPTYYHHDQLGSTRMLTNSSGEATGSFSYNAYGIPSGNTGSQTTPLGFAGQYAGKQSDLQYLRARVYDPETGQFLTRDSLAGLTQQPYAYASDNPLNRVDPSGLCNWNPFSGSFWTEGNCLSESPFNPITYYEREVKAIEAGCSYWQAVTYGLQGAGVAALDAAGLYLAAGATLAAAEATPAAVDTVSVLAREFAAQYPRLYLFILERASKVGTGPPVVRTAAVFFWSWMEEHLRH